MTLIVQKYGGTSVGSPEKIDAVAEKIGKFRDDGDDIVVVVSAMSGETNRLTSLAQEITEQPIPREMDVLLSTGEQVTIALLCMALKKRGYAARSFTGGQVRILTDNSHTKARIKEIDSSSMRAELDQGNIVVVAGFQGVDDNENITTLGRGGSDTTAVALAAALDADECQIYTDVDGIYTTDPRVVPEARKLKSITFEEMLELASLGSKVLQTRSVECAGKFKVKLRVLSSFEAAGEGSGVPRGGARELVPRARHGARERGGDRRAVRAREPPSDSQADEAVDAEDHRVRRPPAEARRPHTGPHTTAFAW